MNPPNEAEIIFIEYMETPLQILFSNYTQDAVNKVPSNINIWQKEPIYIKWGYLNFLIEYITQGKPKGAAI